jgi:hypothetical protein
MVQARAGHSQYAITERYIHASRVAAAHRSFSPPVAAQTPVRFGEKNARADRRPLPKQASFLEGWVLDDPPMQKSPPGDISVRGSQDRDKERLRFEYGVDEVTEIICTTCGGTFPFERFARDSSRPLGIKYVCKPCDAARVLAAYYAKRGPQPVRHCTECGVELEGKRRVVCSATCRERRFRRLRPEAYAAREAAKVVRRREARRRAREAATAARSASSDSSDVG